MQICLGILGSPCGPGGLSLTLCLPPSACKYAAVSGSDRTQVLPSQLNMVEFHWDPTKRIPSSCRSIASALSSHLRKKVERMVSLSTSRLTPSSSVTRGFHLRTCILLALSSKYLRPCSSPSITLDTSQCSPAKAPKSMELKYSHLDSKWNLILSHHLGMMPAPGTGCVGEDLVEKQEAAAPTLRHAPEYAMWLRRAKIRTFAQITSAFHPSGEWVGVGCSDETTWFEDKSSSNRTIYPSISVPAQSLTGIGILTVLRALHRPLYSSLCSQSHWKVGKGKQNSWERLTRNNSWEKKGGSQNGKHRKAEW
ncbi:uncharacterized protein isoform X2 [Castor canadensis]|uniref:Uncharacterized protein isoform X2 n=6 Tax=Castor canadensis TaxID=51338 RepID=A0AC58KAL2_CASCN